MKAALSVQSNPRCAINQSRASRAIKAALRAQSKARFARQLVIQANIFLRFARNQ
jgi:hypothetical protein